ncbi:serine hydrolase domain-containing protein [Aegicerativicinus sediminis]
MKIFSVTLLVIVQSFLVSAQTPEKNYSEAFKLIDIWLEGQKDYLDYPGVSLAIIKDQELLHTSAFGKSNLEDNVAMEPGTLCSICSISKLFTSVAIMKLYDEGKLRLDDEINDILPWFNLKQAFPDSGPITIRSILTHSSGLPRESDYPYWNGPDFKFPSSSELEKKMGEQETLYPASTNFQYSNLGISLLGKVVEQISGMSYEEFVQKNILIPLSLQYTRPTMPKQLYGKELAVGYGALDRNHKREKLNFFTSEAITPAAGFSSNVLDLVKFASWQFRLLENNNVEVLKPSTLRYMQTVQWVNPDFGTTWGLGFTVFEGNGKSKWVGHNGSCPGYQSSLIINPKTKMGYSVMINANGTNPISVAFDVHSILQKAEKTEGFESEYGNQLEDYVGFYNSQPWSNESYLSTWNGKLVMIDLPTDSPADSMTFYKEVNKDEFARLRDDGSKAESIYFQRDNSGRITSFKVHGYISVKKDKK